MIHHIKSSELKTATWAGGTTTQLDIRPSTAEYQKFNFDFRVSFATVEIEESTFTFMPGVTRHLMILNGDLHIDHIDRYQKDLKKFDVDVFNGEWPTKAKGKVKDFNLMTRGSYEGTLEAVVLKKNEEKQLDLGGHYTGIYILSGIAAGEHKSTTLLIREGDYLGIENETGAFQIKGESELELVIARVLAK